MLGTNALTQDHFTLFGLPQRFSVDADALTENWRRLQTAVHPDRFAGAGSAQMRLAMQWSTQVNTAYRTLKDPQQRAAYLCELRGEPIDAERNTAMPPEFLMQQLQWREQLDEARDAGDRGALRLLADEVAGLRGQTLDRLAELLDAPPDPQGSRAAAEQVRVLMFIDKFHQDLASLLASTPSDTSTAA